MSKRRYRSVTLYKFSFYALGRQWAEPDVHCYDRSTGPPDRRCHSAGHHGGQTKVGIKYVAMPRDKVFF